MQSKINFMALGSFWTILVVIGLTTKTIIAVGGVCAQIVHGNFYDLGNLQSADDYVVDVDSLNGKIYFNLCSFARTKCPQQSNSYAVFKSEDRCIPLTSGSIASGYNSSLINYANGKQGLNISFGGIIPYDAEGALNGTKYNVEFGLICVPDKEDYNWMNPAPLFYPNNASFVIVGSGSANCPKYNGSFLVDFLNKFSFLNAVFAIVAGIFQAFYGYKLYKPTIFLIGFIFGFIAVGLFLFAVWTGQDSGSFKGYIILVIALVAGGLTGYVASSFAWVGLVVSGAILGFFISMILYTLILFRIVSYPPNLLFYNILVVGMALGAISGYEYQQVILVLSCGISGAYMTIRGLSVFFGGFPNEFELATKLKTGQDTSTGWAFYFYMILMAAMAVGGIHYQTKLKNQDQATKDGLENAKGNIKEIDPDDAE